MSDLGIFIDESGDVGSSSEFYLITLVFHDQSPWPLVDAFELADCAEEQLFRSLGVSLSSFKASLKPLLRLVLAVGCHVALLRRGFSATSGRSSGWLARDDDMEISLTFPELNLNSL